MAPEDKQLLLKDLCARLPYEFTIYRLSDNANIKINGIDDFAHFLEYSDGEEFKPYLRPMSSMTEKEVEKYNELCGCNVPFPGIVEESVAEFLDWLNEHHFDYRGLIEKGLALEAPEGMYSK